MSIASLIELVDQKALAGFALLKLDLTGSETWCYGSTDFEEGYLDRDVTKTTLYDLASLTKVIGTTTRLLQLIDEKKLTLTTPVCHIIKERPNLTMTLEDLLRHRAGLIADFANKRTFAQDQFWNFLANYQEPRAKKTLYSDLGFLLLGEIIECVEGCNLEMAFFPLFQSLKMKHTGYYPLRFKKFAIAATERTTKRGLIRGVVADSKAYRYGKPVGHAGLFSNLADLTLFVQAFLQQKLFSSTLYQEFLVETEGRTLGWQVEQQGQLWHTGFTGPLLCIDLKKQKALVLLTNRTYPNRDDKGYLAVRTALKQQFFET